MLSTPVDCHNNLSKDFLLWEIFFFYVVGFKVFIWIVLNIN